MNTTDILALRLQNQLITRQEDKSPEEIVRWFGAIQAQDYTAAKWAIGLRSQQLTDQHVEKAYNAGKILRTHVMRPTWHFVLPDDIRWMLTLTKERVHQSNQYYYNRSGLDKATLHAWTEFIRKLLSDRTHVTRDEIGKTLSNTFQITKDVTITISLALMYAELEGVICSGPRQGKQFTYVLMDKHIPQKSMLDTEAALAELTLRYFQSHGPATIQDFAWWSGLSASDIKKGLALQTSSLHQEKIDNTTYYFVERIIKKSTPTVYLLPNYDEYIVGYKNRDFIFDRKHTVLLDARANPLFQHTIMLNGKIIGTWKREIKAKSIMLNTNIFDQIDSDTDKMVNHAITQFSKYIEKPMQ